MQLKLEDALMYDREFQVNEQPLSSAKMYATNFISSNGGDDILKLTQIQNKLHHDFSSLKR
ncbi:hypothetical protein OIU79_000647 [Salix purpurea]|uniref:Uncharacterized protein n=1 Tax=Salix purpurea TaxID=77065 RepID=A0A9Q0V2K1_SALPP|nr:hypothetical protein OIU79_000647 [Salix purpurea]